MKQQLSFLFYCETTFVKCNSCANKMWFKLAQEALVYFLPDCIAFNYYKFFVQIKLI